LFYQRVVKPLVWGEPTDEARVQKALDQDIPAALDYLEGELPAQGFLFGQIGVADIAIASFFRNAHYADYNIDASRWPRAATFIERTLGHSCLAMLLPFEDVQRNASIKGRRQALIDAGARLTDTSLGSGEARRGPMQL
jgi:glutathione S-transferase